MARELLLTERNTQAVCRKVLKAFKGRYARECLKGVKVSMVRAVFEHGQWWVTCWDENEEEQRVFSAVTCGDSIQGDYVDFEEC